MRSGFVDCTTPSGRHRMAYVDWGALDNPRVAICVHGLTRCGRDFDALSLRLQETHRVICPDVVGRGLSDWLTDAKHYNYGTYVSDMQSLIYRLLEEGAGGQEGAMRSIDWVGTSMGGIIGMMLAAQPQSRIRRLVMNDVGTLLPRAALARIGEYVGREVKFDSFGAIVDAIRAVSPFGPLSVDEWRALTTPLVKQDNEGRWMFRYDPAIGNAFATPLEKDVDLSGFWNEISAPTLLLRGGQSDLFSAQNFAQMCAKPGVEGIEIANTGHAPMLQDDATIGAICGFLNR